MTSQLPATAARKAWLQRTGTIQSWADKALDGTLVAGRRDSHTVQMATDNPA